MKWLRELFSPFPWDQAEVRKRLRPLQFRVATSDDYHVCEELHRLNEPYGVPNTHRNAYVEALRSARALTLVVEEAGAPVATCGIHLSGSIAMLSYGMVHPARHRCGIGTTMLIGRIALLPVGMPDFTLGMSALDGSVAFYRGLGFHILERYRDPEGFYSSLAILTDINSELIEACRTMIVTAGGTLPKVVIPSDPEPNQALQPTGPSARG